MELKQGDCLELMKELQDESIDCIITDPPYNISKENDNRDRSKADSPVMRRKSPLRFDFGEWDNKTREDFLQFTTNWLKECCRVLKDGGAIISFFNKEDISYLGWVGKKEGIRTRLIFTWCKSNPVPSFRKVNYLSATEYIWIGNKGTKAWTFNFKMQKEMKNYMITSNSSAYKKTGHPTEKPEELIKHFIEIHTNKGDVILDPFMGSGTTGVACQELQRNFIGFELDDKYFAIAKKRIEEASNQGRLHTT